MNKKNNHALVRKSSSAIEKAKPRAKRILSGIVTDTLALSKREEQLRIVQIYYQEWFLEMIEWAIRAEFKNVTIQPFQDGDLVWQELLRADPDFLIMDFNHSGLNGFDILPLLAAKKAKYPILITDPLLDKAGEDHVLQLAGPNLNVTWLYMPFTTEQFYKVLSKQLGTRLQFLNNKS